MAPPKEDTEKPLFPDLPCYFSNTTTGTPLAATPECKPGFYCPNIDPNNSLTVPVQCPASTDCSFKRLVFTYCNPQGKYEPVVCKPGFYCPTPTQSLPCPEGYYCLSGSVAPKKCEPLAFCPAGSAVQQSYTAIVICVVIDVALLVAFLVVRVSEIKRAGSSWTEILPSPVRKVLRRRELKRSGLARTLSRRSTRGASGPHVDIALQSLAGAQVAPAAADGMLTHRKPASTASVDGADADAIDVEDANDDAVQVPPAEASTVVDISRLTTAWGRGLGGRDLRVDFKFSEMGLQLPSGKSILSGVTGEIKSSRMTAIMGPSGAGKTTFMNVLCGKVSRTKGDLFVNGKRAEIPDYKKIMGYVPQDDVMLHELTVREIVLHSARCRLPRSWTSAEIEKYVDDLLVALNLAHVAHTVIGDETTRGVSGGQRKRVNIAMEMAAVPICLFLDEPTSGLDSTAALDVASILNQITQLGMTIVAVIHQPRIEVFRKFDDVLMIAPGGRTAYLGSTVGARPYFERLGFVFDPLANEADVLMDILAGKGNNVHGTFTADDLVHMWNKSSLMQATVLNKPSGDSLNTVHSSSGNNRNDAGPSGDTAAQSTSVAVVRESEDMDAAIRAVVKERGSSALRQTLLCHNRSLTQQMRMASTLVLETAVGMLAGLMMGLAIGNADEAYSGVYVMPYTGLSSSPIEFLVPLLSLLIGLSIALASGSSGVTVFSEEKPLFWREAAAGHSRIGYYLGKTLATFYRITLSSLHFVALYRFLAHPAMTLENEFVVILLTFFGVYGAAAIVSMLVRRENAGLLSVVVNLFAAVFCGYGPTLLDAKSWGIIFIWELSFNKWGAEALYSEALAPYRGIYMVDFSAEQLGYTLDRFGFDVAMMLAIGVAWRVVGFVLMIALNRDKQR
ncbi:hypothetical protein HK105_201857 [Polyrhizophydium stewartii]|uniref:ABC transporter domain-containing protein n=1 Tax=Polyrhizophydium stewartii TaxID=2732419 RepID=A0ABR4NFZ9_9FUNG|nr:hypothetical protein HK105_000619 [Polyrhizophydium stewartii]